MGMGGVAVAGLTNVYYYVLLLMGVAGVAVAGLTEPYQIVKRGRIIDDFPSTPLSSDDTWVGIWRPAPTIRLGLGLGLGLRLGLRRYLGGDTEACTYHLLEVRVGVRVGRTSHAIQYT